MSPHNRNVDVQSIATILGLLIGGFDNETIGDGGTLISFAPIAFWNLRTI